MKVFNVIRKIVLVLSFVFAGVAFVLGAITLDQAAVAFSTALLGFILIGFVGFFLICSKNQIANRLGLGISTGFMVVLLYLSISALEASSSAILGLVAVILYALYFLVTLIGYLAMGDKGDNDPDNDPRVKKLLGWKNLKEKGIITLEEFEEKRQEILGIKKAANKK